MTGSFTRTLIFCTQLLFCCQVSAAQSTDSAWFEASQPYLRIPVAFTAMYRISAQELARAGVPVAKVKAGTYRMFRRGREIAIEVHAAPMGVPDTLDHLIFYGQKNEGTADTSLYVAPSAMPGSPYSLYSDTAAYFLTWGGTAPGLRMDTVDVTATIPVADYHLQQVSQLYTSHYATGPFYPAGSNFENGSALSAYDVGEGWTGQELWPHQTRELSADLHQPIIAKFDHATITLLLTGRSEGVHQVEIWSGREMHRKRRLGTVKLTDFETKQITLALQASDLTSFAQVHCTIVPVRSTGSLSVSYFQVRYPQLLAAADTAGQQTIFPESPALLSVSRPDRHFFDCTNPFSPKKLLVRDSIVQTGRGPVMAVCNYRHVAGFRLIHFSEWNCDQIDYLIITHPLLRHKTSSKDPVLAYAQYRASPAGGRYKPCIVAIEDVYNAFNAGDPGPTGIMNMVRWFQKAGKLKFVFLVGHGTDPQTARRSPEASRMNLVPSAGWPGSDWLLVEDAEGKPLVPVGRLNATEPHQVWNYLLKVKALEAEPAAAEWRKHLLHLSGGRTPEEITLFRDFLTRQGDKLAGSAAGLLVRTQAKTTSHDTEPARVAAEINRGVALLTFLGHAGLDFTDLDIGQADAPGTHYANGPHYPAIIANGCATGSIFHSDQSLSQNWILVPEKGAVLFLGHAFNGTAHSLMRYTESIYDVLADSNFTSEPFGMVLQEAIIRNQADHADIFDRITMQQMILHGDPAIRIFPARLPDYLPVSVKISDLRDSIQLQINIRNNGRYRPEELQVVIRRRCTGECFGTTCRAIAVEDNISMRIPSCIPFSEQEEWEIHIDPEEVLREEDVSNNLLVVKGTGMSVPNIAADHVAPLLDVLVDGKRLADHDDVGNFSLFSITLSDDWPPPADTSCISIWVRRQCAGCEWLRLNLDHAAITVVSKYQFRLSLHVAESLLPGSYEILMDARDSSGNFTEPYHITFRIGDLPAVRLVNVAPNPSSRWFRFTLHGSGLTENVLLHIVIANQSGQVIDRIPMQLRNGLNECFWEPAFAASGIFLYRLEWQERSTMSVSGGSGNAAGRLLRVE